MNPPKIRKPHKSPPPAYPVITEGASIRDEDTDDHDMTAINDGTWLKIGPDQHMRRRCQPSDDPFGNSNNP